MTKEQLRKIYKAERKQLADASYAKASRAIIAQLEQRDWSSCAYIHVYLPIQKMREIDTWPFMDWLQDNYPAMHIIISRSNPADFSMQHYHFVSRSSLLENDWGILEPFDGDLVDILLLDVVIVPLLVADKHGNRVGYGKGFYDRFLAGCRPDCLKLGLSLFEPVPFLDDVHPQDIPLDELITPTRTYSFK